jgi:hypothetical protein
MADICARLLRFPPSDGQAGSYRFVRRISNALVLTGLANFRVVGNSGNNREVLTSPVGQGTGWADKFKTEGFISAMALRALCFCVVLESDDAATLFR